MRRQVVITYIRNLNLEDNKEMIYCDEVNVLPSGTIELRDNRNKRVVLIPPYNVRLIKVSDMESED